MSKALDESRAMRDLVIRVSDYAERTHSLQIDDLCRAFPVEHRVRLLWAMATVVMRRGMSMWSGAARQAKLTDKSIARARSRRQRKP